MISLSIESILWVLVVLSLVYECCTLAVTTVVCAIGQFIKWKMDAVWKWSSPTIHSQFTLYSQFKPKTNWNSTEISLCVSLLLFAGWNHTKSAKWWAESRTYRISNRIKFIIRHRYHNHRLHCRANDSPKVHYVHGHQCIVRRLHRPQHRHVRKWPPIKRWA